MKNDQRTTTALESRDIGRTGCLIFGRTNMWHRLIELSYFAINVRHTLSRSLFIKIIHAQHQIASIEYLCMHNSCIRYVILRFDGYALAMKSVPFARPGTPEFCPSREDSQTRFYAPLPYTLYRLAMNYRRSTRMLLSAMTSWLVTQLFLCRHSLNVSNSSILRNLLVIVI